MTKEHKKSKTLNPQGELVKRLIIANPKRKMRSILIEAGYAESYADHPNVFFKHKTGQDLAKWITGETAKIQKQMNKTRKDARYIELANTLIGLQKLGNLNRGDATENINVTLEDLLKQDREDN